MPRPRRRPEGRKAAPRSRRRNRAAPVEPPEPASGRVAIARIRRPWGTDGSLAVTPFASQPERLSSGTRVFVGGKPTVILSAHPGGSAVVIRVESIRTVNAAEPLRGTLVEVAREDLPPPPASTYYHYQLVDARVRSVDGDEIGTVTSVLETGSNDVYVVQPPGGGKPVLIPAITDVVREIDIEARLITVDLPDGLL